MSVRGAGPPPMIRPPATQPGAAAAPNPTPGDAMMRLGLMKPGMNPQAMLASLLGFLMQGGFASKGDSLKPGGDDAKLSDALKNLQQKEGLPQTGKLDEKTLKAMEKYKAATPANVEKPQDRVPAKPQDQATARAANSFRDQSMAAWIKNKAADLPQQLQQRPPATQTQTANATPATQQAARMAQDAAMAQLAMPPPPPQENPATKARTETDAQQLRQQPQADGRTTRTPQQDSSRAQLQQEQRDGAGKQGQDGAGKTRDPGKPAGNGKLEEKAGGQSQDAEGLARGDADQMAAFEDGRGNQATGDEDEEDERRGAALVDDGSGEDEGSYEVKSVREQVDEALRALMMEKQQGANRTTTYKVDFVLYKPGFYQSATQAPQLLNLKVVKATAYDQVWAQVVEQVNARLRVFEPDAEPLMLEDVQTALQVARVRGM